MNRRVFVQLSAAAMLSEALAAKVCGQRVTPSVSHENGRVLVKGGNYSWEYVQAEDLFHLTDSRNLPIASGAMQPAVVVTVAEQPKERLCARGKVAGVDAAAGKVTIRYEGVNHSARMALTWRFDEHGIWMDPIAYEATRADEIVSVHYFAHSGADGSGEIEPSLHSTYFVVPGIISGSTISPILRDTGNLKENVWLGRGSPVSGLMQQWGLPVHYFCGFSFGVKSAYRDMYSERRGDAFTCGLADLPNGDLFLQLADGKASPWINYRSDLWKQLHGPGTIPLGATWLWAVAPDYYRSIGAYYQGLLQAGVIHKKENSEHKNAIALTPQFCTWGAQVMRGKAGNSLDEAFLTELYGDLKKSGMKAGLFSIDDKWEGAYGNLEHSAERFPHFEEFLARLRADGLRVGMWAAIMRCERPADLGLTTEHVLQTPEGKPYVVGAGEKTSYYILDFTQPEVAEVLTKVVRRFVRRYKPDVFKFDFGYEIPAIGEAAPSDKRWGGERLMWKGLDVVIKAMREENPDQVVMYYNLSPLFLEFFDLHSPDDLFLDTGDYEVEGNRRIYFSSLMGQLGVPTYGSSGYDWASAPSIWFDSAAVGTIGSLNDFEGDEESEKPTPQMIAKYNGITQVLRSGAIFDVLPVGDVSISPSNGAHARSWARFEKGEMVLYAYRPVPRGEEDLLRAASERDARVDGVLHSEMPVIVASKSAQDITASKELAMVAYGAGTIDLRRSWGKNAEIVSHYFGGESSTRRAAVAGGRLKFAVEEADAKGMPLEWVEVRLT